ncbi:MAG: hypothetical protein ACRDNZ_24045 [Streptosporangiaceae bacterium]
MDAETRSGEWRFVPIMKSALSAPADELTVSIDGVSFTGAPADLREAIRKGAALGLPEEFLRKFAGGPGRAGAPR